MGAIICFDLSSRDSFYNLENWVTQVKDSVSENCTIFLVGCKDDLPNSVTQKEIDDFLYQMNMMYFDESLIDSSNGEEKQKKELKFFKVSAL